MLVLPDRSATFGALVGRACGGGGGGGGGADAEGCGGMSGGAGAGGAGGEVTAEADVPGGVPEPPP